MAPIWAATSAAVLRSILEFAIMAEESNHRAELVGVFGYPVSENPTVVMQEAAFQALNLNWYYLTIEVRPQDLADAVLGLRASNMRGINLTIPHRVAVLQYPDEDSPDAKLIGAMNTVWRQDGRLVGEDTAGKGFLASLKDEAKVDPAGKNVVVLGAGGPARAVAVERGLACAGEITIVNRSVDRGEDAGWSGHAGGSRSDSFQYVDRTRRPRRRHALSQAFGLA
jgi:shikimate dehydrogenase